MSQSPGLNDPLNHADQATTLWEAMGKLHNIQTQEKIAQANGDIELLRDLLEQQTEAWQVVCVQARKLVASGKAPQDMIEHLEEILNIHHNHQQWLQEAKANIQAKLAQLDSTEQPTKEREPPQAGSAAA